MKHSLILLLSIFCFGVLSAQDADSAPKYPYRIVYQAEHLPVGNHIFKNDFDYVNYMNKNHANLMMSKAFFSPNESGVVLSRLFSSGSYGFIIDRVEETDSQVIVYAKVITPKGPQDCMMSGRCIFVAVQQTVKDIVVMETTE